MLFILFTLHRPVRNQGLYLLVGHGPSYFKEVPFSFILNPSGGGQCLYRKIIPGYVRVRETLTIIFQPKGEIAEKGRKKNNK